MRGFAGVRGRGAGFGFAAWVVGALPFSAELQPVSARTRVASKRANFAIRGILSIA